MIKVLSKLLMNILTALYEPFGFSLLLSFLAMFFYLYAYEPTAAGKDWKNVIITWYQKLTESIIADFPMQKSKRTVANSRRLWKQNKVWKNA